MSPRLRNRLKLYENGTPILEYYGIEDEIERAYVLRSGCHVGGTLF